MFFVGMGGVFYDGVCFVVFLYGFTVVGCGGCVQETTQLMGAVCGGWADATATMAAEPVAAGWSWVEVG